MGVVILGVGALGPSIAGGVTDDATDTAPGTSSLMTSNHSSVDIAVDCNENNVSLTAPTGYEYDLTVGVANITAESNSVSRSSSSVEGNATVDLGERGIVFTIVQNESADEEVVASDVTDCRGVGEATTTLANETEPGNETEPTNGTEPRIQVDCEENVVQFIASEDTDYVGKVSVIDLSATGTSTSSTTQTLEGNETVSVEGGGIIAAFASTGDLGDDRTVSVVRNCSPFGTDENETATTTEK